MTKRDCHDNRKCNSSSVRPDNRYFCRSLLVWVKQIAGQADVGTSSTGELFEPVDLQDSQNGWIVGLLQSLSASADLNAKAAVWTAASVVFARVSSILSAF
jgi:hypothetical protein